MILVARGAFASVREMASEGTGRNQLRSDSLREGAAKNDARHALRIE